MGLKLVTSFLQSISNLTRSHLTFFRVLVYDSQKEPEVNCLLWNSVIQDYHTKLLVE